MVDRALLSLSELLTALKENGLSISSKTLQRRSDEMGLAFGHLNGQRVYCQHDVPRIAERLSHYKAGNLPKRGRPKQALTLLSLPVERRIIELGLALPEEAGADLAVVFHARSPLLSDDELNFYGGLAADARSECLAGKGCFSKKELADDRDTFQFILEEAYYSLQQPSRPEDVN